MTIRFGSWLLLLSLGAGCAPTTDWEDVEGIERSADEIFRFVDYPETQAGEAFDTLERQFRLRFAGTRLVLDRVQRTIETEPMGFARSPMRVTVYGQVTEPTGVARIELFAKVERLRDDLREQPDAPWMYIGADAQLENTLFEELWDVLVVRKRVAGETSPAPAEDAPRD